MRRAVEGWDEPVYQGGMLVGLRRRYSDALLIRLLKANNPAKFGDKVSHARKGEVPAAVVVYELPTNGR